MDILQLVGVSPEDALMWLAVARGVLLILDAVDEKLPKVKVVTKWLGTLLGGSRPR